MRPLPELTPAEKLRIACELFDFGLQIKAQNLLRENPNLTPEKHASLLQQWLDGDPIPSWEAAGFRVIRYENGEPA